MKIFTCQFVQNEVSHQMLRVGSKKHALSLPEGSVQSCPESLEGKAAHGLIHPERGHPCFTHGAYA
jgi:hypothetical protein